MKCFVDWSPLNEEHFVMHGYLDGSAWVVAECFTSNSFGLSNDPVPTHWKCNMYLKRANNYSSGKTFEMAARGVKIMLLQLGWIEVSKERLDKILQFNVLE